MARWRHAPLTLSFLVTLLSAVAVLASRDEYQVKAAFLLNFAKLVKWPESVWPAAGEPIVLGVMGEESVTKAMSEKLAGAKVGDHPVAVRILSRSSEVAGCHIVFMATGHDNRAILKAARSHAALSVGESEGFATRGGVINFFNEGKKLRFEINTTAAAEAGLKISSRLLRLAKLVSDP